VADEPTTTTTRKSAQQLTAELAAYFDPQDVKFKPQSVKGNRALALAYIDARAVQARLDDVLGVEGWQDDYTIVADGSVVCKLSCRLGSEWVSKMDVGSQSEQPDGGDRLKAAFSDALKRTAVKFGVGRYLYRLPSVWCDYDVAKRQFAQTPALPTWAIPAKQRAGAKKATTTTEANNLPANGEELHRRLRDYDAKLAAQKKCTLGALLTHVANAGKRAGYGDDLTQWAGPAIPFAVESVKEFEALVNKPAANGKAPPAPTAASVAKLGQTVYDQGFSDWLSSRGIPDPAALKDCTPKQLAELDAELKRDAAANAAEGSEVPY